MIYNSLLKVPNWLRYFGVAFMGASLAILTFTFLMRPKNVYIKENYGVFSRFASQEIPDFIIAAEKSVPSVVHVKTRVPTTNYQDNLLYDFFFGDRLNSGAPVVASGSGVIISSDGYIVTNNHVIEKSEQMEVILMDKRSYKARFIGSDPFTDIALLKIDEKDLTPIVFGNSDNLRVGEWVLAVGNPFNLTSTVTAGIVSAKGRNINILTKKASIESFIQTDAAVNPGNSGGALVNINGDLIGINTAIASPTGSFSGYSFAIPVSIVKKVINDLIEFGAVQRAVLGVDIKDIDAELAKTLKLEKIEGVYIAGIEEGGSAVAAGIIKDDIILKIEDMTVNNVSELQEQLSKFSPGNKIKLTIKRDKAVIEFYPVLKNREGNTNIIDNNLITSLGATFEEVQEEEKKKLKIKSGLKVVDLRAGKLMKAGVEKGYIITIINRQHVTTLIDLHRILEHVNGGVYIEGVYPNGTTSYYAFGIR